MDSLCELKSHCFVNSNMDDDCFVGVRGDQNGVSVHFPLGYRLSNDEKDIRKDILNLFRIISAFSLKKQSVLLFQHSGEKQNIPFPINAYLTIVSDFMNKGSYYQENEIQYVVGNHGKINWKRTIKKCTPLIQDNFSPIYTSFVTGRTVLNANKIITGIHKYCVYESFMKIGWIFTDYIPEKHLLPVSDKEAIKILNDCIRDMNNDRNKLIFMAMKELLESSSCNDSTDLFYYGTQHFEYVWQDLVDCVFGISNKSDYFPKVTWKLKHKSDGNKHPLEPDTIMIHDDKVYVLDSKYYKYGKTGLYKDLPNATDINKQITYGEYVVENKQVPSENVYNAFIMPYNKNENVFGFNQDIISVGEAIGEWRKKPLKNFERIQGVVVDVKTLIECYLINSDDMIKKLSDAIIESLREDKNDDKSNGLFGDDNEIEGC